MENSYLEPFSYNGYNKACLDKKFKKVMFYSFHDLQFSVFNKRSQKK